MFDIGFSELFLIAIVALVVLGPERLPKAARFAGLWVRRARAQWYSVKSELERELATEELQRTLRETRQAAAEIDAEVRSAGEEARREFDSMRAQIADDGRRGDDPAGPETTAVVATEDRAQDDPQSRARDDGAGDDRR
jgi:sec-independent protein translocase protein TatB